MSVACLAVLVLVLGSAQPARAAARVLAGGVTSVVRDTPSLADPGYAWASIPDCATAPAEPAVFYRDSVALGRPRAIFSFNPPRAAGACNPYRLLSDIVTDGTWIYYVDNQGSAGSAALWRRRRDANPEDASQLLNALTFVQPVSAELIRVQGVLFAILHLANYDVDYLLAYDKQTGSQIGGLIQGGSRYSLGNMQYDGRYLFWMNLGSLWWDDTWTGNMGKTLAGPIQSYHADGYFEECYPGTCSQVSFVSYGQGNSLFVKEIISNTTYPAEYTSAVANAQFTSITRDGIYSYVVERRPSGGFSRDDRIYRIGGAQPALIYGPVDNGGPGFDAFTTDRQFLYFRNRSTGVFNQLPNDEAAIPIRDLAGTGLEVTQGLQDTSNSQRLVAGKRTIVRFYAKSVRPGDERVEGVTAALYGRSGKGELGRLEPIGYGAKLSAVLASPKRSNLSNSFQFELPASWTEEGSLLLSARVNPDGRVIEDDADDNSWSTIVSFLPSAHYEVTYYNFGYTLNGLRYRPGPVCSNRAPNGAIVPCSTSADCVPQLLGSCIDGVAASQERMRRLYPIAEPGSNPSGPGLFFRSVDLIDEGLAEQVVRTAKSCTDNYAKTDDRQMCASDYLHGKLNALRAKDVSARSVWYANIAQAPGFFTRGYFNGGFIASGPSPDATIRGGELENMTNYAAHEIGHVLGRMHPSEGSSKCGHTSSDPAYPHALGSIGFGIDPETRVAGLDFSGELPGRMIYLDASSNYDMMTYCSPYWISDYTTNGIYDSLDSLPAVLARAEAPRGAVNGDWLIASGSVEPERRSGRFTVVERTGAVADPGPPTAGPLVLELRGGTGVVLASYPFAGSAVDDVPGRFAFGVVVPFVAGTTQLRVIDGATRAVLAVRSVSPSAPTVADVRLPGAPNPVNGIVNVEWTASDADGDTLAYDLSASRDGGQTFRPIVLGIATNHVSLDTSMLGGGTNRLRIVASDGVNTATAESASFTVPARPPVPWITSPLDGFAVDWGQLVSFAVEVKDLQDAFVPDDRIVWTNQYGPLGAGRRLQTDRLQVGENRIRVTATNSLGVSGGADLKVIVGDRLAPPAATLSVDPATIGWQVAADDTTPQVRSLSVSNAGGAELRFDVSTDAAWLLVDSARQLSSLVAPRSFTVTAVTSLVPTGVTTTGHLTFRNAASPADVFVVPVHLTRGNGFDQPGLGGIPTTLVGTKSLKLKDGAPSKRSFSYTSSDPSIAPPAPGSAGDPTQAGATLAIYNALGGLDRATLALPSGSSWRRSGSTTSPIYSYKSRSGTISSLTLKAGKLVVKGKGTGLPSLAHAPQGAMALRLVFGSAEALCTSVPAKSPLADTTGSFGSATNVSRPDVCPVDPAG
ncbi:MAG: hypothetical protein ACKOCT_20195 [Alphaproteobacteria bacterium]